MYLYERRGCILKIYTGGVHKNFILKLEKPLGFNDNDKTDNEPLLVLLKAPVKIYMQINFNGIMEWKNNYFCQRISS